MSDATRFSSNDDMLLRFVLAESGVSGVLVRLSETWRAVRGRTDYPADVEHRLGETLAATALMTGHAKIDGRLSVQLRGTGALRSLFAECTREGTLRGLAHYEEPLPSPLGPRAFGPGSMLAITIETIASANREGTRYQGLVGLDADTMAEAFEGYFAQSEQLPTRMLLAADASHAAGIMVQKLPGAVDDEGWRLATALFETLAGPELLASEPAELLLRLFHEDGIRLRDQRPLRFGCSCSRERVAAMLQGLGRDEALAAVQPAEPGHAGSTPEEPAADISCEFCGQRYRFSGEQVEALFQAVPAAPGTATLQ